MERIDYLENILCSKEFHLAKIKNNRSNIYEEIINFFTTKYKNVPENKEVIILGGLFGSGKSYYFENNFTEKDYAVINLDDIVLYMAEKNYIPEFKDLKPLERMNLVFNEAFNIGKNLLDIFISENKNICIHISFRSYSSISAKINKLINSGYSKINIYYINTNIEDSKKNALNRYLKNYKSKLGERYIPNYIFKNSEDKYFTSNNLSKAIKISEVFKLNLYIINNKGDQNE